MFLSPINRSGFIQVVPILGNRSVLISGVKDGEASPVHDKAYIKRIHTAPLVLNFGIRCTSVVNFASRPLYRGGKIPRYSANKWLDGPIPGI